MQLKTSTRVIFYGLTVVPAECQKATDKTLPGFNKGYCFLIVFIFIIGEEKFNDCIQLGCEGLTNVVAKPELFQENATLQDQKLKG